jgi:hypothetical protein
MSDLQEKDHRQNKEGETDLLREANEKDLG